MSDTEGTTPEQGTTPEPKEDVTPAAPKNEPVQSETVENLPAYGQKIIKELREENAKRRTQQEEAVTKAAEAAKTESLKQYNELSNQYEDALKAKSTAELEYAKLETALSVGVEPAKAKAFAARLRGETPEELLKDAQEMVAVFGSQEAPRRGDPSQGRVSQEQPLTGLAALIQNAQTR